MQVNEEKTFFIRICDLTALYGAGNEPTSVDTFLSQHPEYNSYVPFYDGKITQRRIIETKAKSVELVQFSWSRDLVGNIYVFYIGPIAEAKYFGTISIEGYAPSPTDSVRGMPNKTAMIANSQAYPVLYIRDDDYNDVASFMQHLQDENAIITYQTTT